MNSGFIPLFWMASHWQAICGWAFVLWLVYSATRVGVKVIKIATDLVSRATTAEQTLKTVASNHLPHIQTELEKSNDHLAGLREEISQVLKVIYPYEKP